MRTHTFGWMAAFLLSLGFLAGCSESSHDADQGRDIGTAMTNSDQPSANATSAAPSVIVLKSGPTTFYIPASWLIRLGGKRVLGSVQPPIEEQEPEGRVHELRPGRGLELNLRIPGRPVIAPNFPVHSLIFWRQEDGAAPVGNESRLGEPDSKSSLREPDALGWAQFGHGSGFVDVHNPSISVDSPHQADVANGRRNASTFPNSSSYSFTGTNVIYKWQESDAPQPEWRDLRKRMGRFLKWLSTPPSDRPAQPNL